MSKAERVLQRAEYIAQMMGCPTDRTDFVSAELSSWNRVREPARLSGEGFAVPQLGQLTARVWTFEDGSQLKLWAAVQLVEPPK